MMRFPFNHCEARPREFNTLDMLLSEVVHHREVVTDVELLHNEISKLEEVLRELDKPLNS